MDYETYEWSTGIRYLYGDQAQVDTEVGNQYQDATVESSIGLCYLQIC